jgi:hypothetical protein
MLSIAEIGWDVVLTTSAAPTRYRLFTFPELGIKMRHLFNAQKVATVRIIGRIESETQRIPSWP